MKNLVRTNIFLSTAEWTALVKEGKRRDVSAAYIIRAVLDAYFGITPKAVAPIVFKTPVAPVAK